MERALAADEVQVRVVNDMMWHDLTLARPGLGEQRPPFARLCELGVVPLKGTDVIPSAVDWLRSPPRSVDTKYRRATVDFEYTVRGVHSVP